MVNTAEIQAQTLKLIMKRMPQFEDWKLDIKKLPWLQRDNNRVCYFGYQNEGLMLMGGRRRGRLARLVQDGPRVGVGLL